VISTYPTVAKTAQQTQPLQDMFGAVKPTAPAAPGPATEDRSGIGHFANNYDSPGYATTNGQAYNGTNGFAAGASAAPPPPAPAPGPASEARSGIDHFNPASSDLATQSGTGAQSGDQPQDYGSQSGPGLLEQWFNERANGTDPGWDYATKRGLASIDSGAAARGSFNSSANAQNESDFMANMAAQREGQLDALAGGASGERQGLLNTMFGSANSLAGGQAGTASNYDMASAGAQSSALNAIIQMMLGKAGVDSQATQAGINNVTSLGGLLAKLYGGGK